MCAHLGWFVATPKSVSYSCWLYHTSHVVTGSSLLPLPGAACLFSAAKSPPEKQEAKVNASSHMSVREQNRHTPYQVLLPAANSELY
jgi:hypothetical protein